MTDHYERLRRQAQAQADHNPSLRYDDDLDMWLFDPLADVSPAARPHVPQMVRELEGDEVIAALCGPMGRT